MSGLDKPVGPRMGGLRIVRRISRTLFEQGFVIREVSCNSGWGLSREAGPNLCYGSGGPRIESGERESRELVMSSSNGVYRRKLSFCCERVVEAPYIRSSMRIQVC